MKKYTVRVQDATALTLNSAFPGFSPTHAAEELLDAAAEWIRRGEKRVLSMFSEQEKISLIGVTNSWFIEPLSTIDQELLEAELHDYLAPGGEGFLLGWSEEAKDEFLRKLRALTPPEALSFVLWGKRYWESEEKDVRKYIGESAKED